MEQLALPNFCAASSKSSRQKLRRSPVVGALSVNALERGRASLRLHRGVNYRHSAISAPRLPVPGTRKGFPQLIQNMQRETGLEPATSSLGIFTSIGNKEHGAYRDAYRSKQNSNPDNRPCKPPLIGGLMESCSPGSFLLSLAFQPWAGHRGCLFHRLAAELTSGYTPI
jgi:hypothetical protein